MSSSTKMILIIWSSLLFSALIQIALLPSGSNAVGQDSQAIREVTAIYNKMKKTDEWNEEKDNLLVYALYAKRAFYRFKAVSHTNVPHQQPKEMEVLEHDILEIFNQAPDLDVKHDYLYQKVEMAVKAVENAVKFYEPKGNPNTDDKIQEKSHESESEVKDGFKENPNDQQHMSQKSAMKDDLKKELINEMIKDKEQMNKFHTWLQNEVQEKIVKAGEKRKDPDEMAKEILKSLHEPGSPFIAPHEGTIEEANENAEGSQHNIRKKLHHHHQHSDSEGPSEQPEVIKKEMTNDQASAHSDNHNHQLGKNGGSKNKQKSDGNGTR